MNNRFNIKELRIIGPNKQPASLVFRPGFNVIDGASNTGKSYAFQCLDYMLGAKDLPEKVDEAIGYIEIYLEITLSDDSPMTFRRSLQSSSDYTMSLVTIDEFATRGEKVVLKKKHEANNKKTFSGAILNLISLLGKEVKKNERNTTRSLSFRDIARLISVDEVEIIAKKSPIYSGQTINKTVEKSVFSLFLAGRDSSDLIEIEETKVRKGRIYGQIALIEKFVEEYNNKLTALNKANTKEEGEHNQKHIAELSDILSELSKEQESLTQKRQELWVGVEKYKSRLLMVDELKGRFQLLQTHYESDLNRLDFITTGEELINQLHAVNCPVCGNDFDKDHFDCNIQSDEGQEIREAIEAEIEKIQIKMSDLVGTIKNLEVERTQLNSDLEAIQFELASLTEKITKELEPRKARTKEAVDSHLQQQKNIAELENIQSRLSELWAEKSKLAQDLKVKQVAVDNTTDVRYSTFKSFCDHVAINLKKWKFSPNPIVEFDTDKMDLVIDGKARSSNGKGFRGVAHTAFIIGLMDYCLDNKIPHPGTVIIDSPLTAYQKAEYTEEDELSTDIETAFFESLLNIPTDRQIIVLDNKSPSDDVKEKINYIHFTKNRGNGRYGLFPIGKKE
jgi:predicted nuclease with TOPRIM domain